MEEKKIVGYDPETGAPIYEETATTQETVETAPETQETPVETESVEAAVDFATPEYSEMPAEESNKKKIGIFIGVVAAVIVIAIGIVLAIMFLVKKPKDIVSDACEKTFENFAKGDNLLFSAIVPKGFEGAKELTLAVEGAYEDTWLESDVSFDVTIAANDDKLQVYGGVKSDSDGIPYIEAVLDATDGQAKLASPLLKNVYVYDFTKECTGFLADYMDMAGISSDDISEYYASIHDAAKDAVENPDKYEDFRKRFEEVADNFEYKKIDSEEFTIDDKDVKCKGYKMIITEENMEEFCDAYLEMTQEAITEGLGAYIEEMSGEDMEDLMEDYKDELMYAFEDMDDIEINFYVYKNELAAITCEVEGEDISIQFQGGDYRAQNMVIEVAGVKAKINSSKDDGVEKFTVKVAKQEVFSYEYDSESGDLSLVIAGEGEIEGINIKSEDGEWTVSLDDFVYEDAEISGSISLTTDAEFKDIDGKEFLLNDASEDDFYEILEEEAGAIEELLY